MSAIPRLLPAHPQRLQQSFPLDPDSPLRLVESLLSPACLVASLWGCAFYFEGQVDAPYIVLGVFVFTLTYPAPTRLANTWAEALWDIVLQWCLIAGLLGLCGWLSGYLHAFSSAALLNWLWIAPVSEMALTAALRTGARHPQLWQGPRQRTLIVGANEQGLALAHKINHAPYPRANLVGLVDNRNADRLNLPPGTPLLGNFQQLAELTRTHGVQQIYLSLPMASQPRILQILDDLKDTTASIYFVPDMFITDLVQGKTGSICGMPVISVCDTPFKGWNGILKRSSDIIIASLALITLTPLLAIISIGVKASSPGPVIFKQRRYGLDGQEIIVYKFRSMTVTEDGESIKQAQKNDARLTPFGSFLRRTSLDELPQFFNVLQGRMSVVGPRPHAVAHNEMYRKLIKGYMVRHKVRPGVTGWAQVNGFRGETATLDKMQGRLDYDLDYLRNWSIKLDLQIIFKTIRLVLKDQSAY